MNQEPSLQDNNERKVGFEITAAAIAQIIVLVVTWTLDLLNVPRIAIQSVATILLLAIGALLWQWKSVRESVKSRALFLAFLLGMSFILNLILLSDVYLESENMRLIYQEFPAINIGGESAVDSYSHTLNDRMLIEFLVIDAHDNLGETQGASLICKLDKRQVGEQDVMAKGSRLFYPVDRHGQEILCEANSDEVHIITVQVFGQ